MRRREFITFLGGTAVARPFLARAQQPAMPVIGLLSVGSKESDTFRLLAFRRGLNELGLRRSQNLGSNSAGRKIKMIACRRWQQIWFVVRRRRLPRSAAPPPALAAKAATATIPIVFMIGGCGGAQRYYP
jgi:putative ABC transport system substrate-binding protein